MRASIRLGPGTSSKVRSGLYNEKLVFPLSGSAAAGSIRLEAFPGDRPVLDGTGVAGANMVRIDSKSRVSIAGFEIRNNLGVNDGSGPGDRE